MIKRLFRRDRAPKGALSAETTARGPVAVPAAAAAQPVLSALGRLCEAEDLLTKRRDLLAGKVKAELLRAEEAARANKKKVAVAALKKRRMYKQQLEQVEYSLLRLSEQLVGLEGVRATAETVAAMQAGAEAGRAVAAELNAQRVDTLLDDVADQAEAMRQVADALGQPLGGALDVDEDELAAELEELEAAQLGGARMQAPAHAITAADQGAASAPPNRQAPAAPRALPVEEEELEAMQADMAM